MVMIMLNRANKFNCGWSVYAFVTTTNSTSMIQYTRWNQCCGDRWVSIWKPNWRKKDYWRYFQCIGATLIIVTCTRCVRTTYVPLGDYYTFIFIFHWIAVLCSVLFCSSRFVCNENRSLICTNQIVQEFTKRKHQPHQRTIPYELDGCVNRHTHQHEWHKCKCLQNKLDSDIFWWQISFDVDHEHSSMNRRSLREWVCTHSISSALHVWHLQAFINISATH